MHWATPQFTMEHKLASVLDVSKKCFDFVIVGGGTAGLVLANRLTENPHFSVVVLEAGQAQFDDPIIALPGEMLRQHGNPSYDWAYTTVPQAGLGGNVIPIGRGKGLGGSSRMNFLIYTRPPREEWDALETLGNPGWNWETFYKYSKKSERFGLCKAPRKDDCQDLWSSEAVGHDGPLSISFARTSSGVETAFQKSLQSNGVNVATDVMSGDVLGVWKTISSIDSVTEMRSTAATAYLLPVIDRPNLAVLTGACVNKIILSGDGGDLVATGVEFEHDGATYCVNAGKEVILSASAIRSPQILELSGIGDRNILDPLGIPVQLDLPTVGTNVQDHITPVVLTYEVQRDSLVATSDTLRDLELAEKFREDHGNPERPLSLALTGVAFIPVQTFSDRAAALIDRQAAKIARNSENYPPGLMEQYEVQLNMLKNKNIPNTEILLNPFRINHAEPTDLQVPIVQMVPTLAQPWSRGTIHITSADPRVNPAVDFQFLKEDIDLELLLDAFKFTRKVGQTEPFQGIVASEMRPGVDVVSDEELIAAIKSHMLTIWHTCGSCSMLPRDKGGVVDPNLKVYGTKNIRVVDLSVLPLMTSVHTQTVVYGIAEQAADIIKKAYSP